MNNREISAYAVYATKKLKKKKSKPLGVEDKSKKILKKKKKKDSVCSKTKSGENCGNLSNTSKKPNEKKKMVRSLLKAQIESIFDDSNAATSLEDSILVQENVQTQKGGMKPIRDHDVKKKNDSNFKTDKRKSLLSHENSAVCSDIKKKEHNVKENSKINESKALSSENKKSEFQNIIYGDSVKAGEEMFSWMISPIEIKNFFDDCWEKKPLHIKRNNKDFFKCVCTLKDFETALEVKDIYFTRNIDVTSYIDGKRFTENPEGKATLPTVWDLYNNGKSIRLLNPQTFIPNVRLLSTTLQEFFQCFVGANLYLTPAGTQGFAPHYDDIEAFVLQLEGEKHWKLYNPRCPEDVLPRESSRNFNEDEIGEPILEIVLKPGDLLYFPRGIIHQARCLPHIHSLHLTVSCYQRNSWADLLEKVLPIALQRAITEDVELRKGLPIGYLNHVGMIFSDQKSHCRQAVVQKFKELTQKILEFCPLDAGADQMAARFIHDALPPCLTEEEKLHGANRNVKTAAKSFLDALKNHSDKELSVKLIRASSARLVSEEGEVLLYYTTDNSLVYHENDASAVTIPMRWTLAVEHLIRTYPNFVQMKTLPVLKKDDKPGKWKHISQFVYFLWQRGLLVFDKSYHQIFS